MDAREIDVRDKSAAELTSDLARQMSNLVHDEIALAKVEMSEKGRRAGRGAGMFGAAGVLAFLGLACFATAAIAGIAVSLPVWAAALIVGGALLLGAGLIALRGKREVEDAAPPLPTAAIQSTKEDVEWLKTHAKSSTQ